MESINPDRDNIALVSIFVFPFSGNNDRRIASGIARQFACKAVDNFKRKVALRRRRMCAYNNAAPGQFRGAAFFIIRNKLRRVCSRLQRRPADSSILIEFGIFLYIAMVYKPLIRNGSLSTVNRSAPVDSLACKNIAFICQDGFDANRRVHVYSRTFKRDGCIVSVFHMSYNRIFSGFLGNIAIVVIVPEAPPVHFFAIDIDVKGVFQGFHAACGCYCPVYGVANFHPFALGGDGVDRQGLGRDDDGGAVLLSLITRTVSYRHGQYTTTGILRVICKCIAFRSRFRGNSYAVQPNFVRIGERSFARDGCQSPGDRAFCDGAVCVRCDPSDLHRTESDLNRNAVNRGDGVQIVLCGNFKLISTFVFKGIAVAVRRTVFPAVNGFAV